MAAGTKCCRCIQPQEWFAQERQLRSFKQWREALIHVKLQLDNDGAACEMKQESQLTWAALALSVLRCTRHNLLLQTNSIMCKKTLAATGFNSATMLRS